MIPTNEISDMAWFLVNITKTPSIDTRNSHTQYCILHMADLIDIEPAEVYINCNVKFMLDENTCEGRILSASNSIIDLILEVELKLMHNTMEMNTFIQQLLHCFPQTLKEIFRMSQYLMEKCKAMENANRINHLLLQVRQLSQDTMEIHEVTQHLVQRLIYANSTSEIFNDEIANELQVCNVTNVISEAVDR